MANSNPPLPPLPPTDDNKEGGTGQNQNKNNNQHLHQQYRAIILRNPNAAQDNSFSGEDGGIFLHGGVEPGGGGTAIESVGGGDVVLKNIYVVGASTIVACTKTGMTLLAGGSTTDPVPAVRVVSYVSTASGGQINDRGAVPRAGVRADARH